VDRAPSSGSTLLRVRAGLLLVNALLAALLAVTGLLLLAGYRPGSVLATFHRQTGRILLVTALLSLVLLMVPRPRLAAAAATVGLLAAALLAFGTGPLVAWQGLFAWGAAVEAGRTSFAGYLWLLGDDVRFAVVNRTELEPSMVVLLLTFHLALGTVTALAALAAATTTGRFPGPRVRGPRGDGRPSAAGAGAEPPGGGA
jgi:hypothetical protein